jgi:hypothetical protein
VTLAAILYLQRGTKVRVTRCRLYRHLTLLDIVNSITSSGLEAGLDFSASAEAILRRR